MERENTLGYAIISSRFHIIAKEIEEGNEEENNTECYRENNISSH
jgi:hypothetical protein